MTKIHRDPGEAFAEDGVVMLDGPGGTAVTMTPDAARSTGKSLAEAADRGDAQNSASAAPEGSE